jgi:hypothetical protein
MLQSFNHFLMTRICLSTQLMIGQQVLGLQSLNKVHNLSLCLLRQKYYNKLYNLYALKD